MKKNRHRSGRRSAKVAVSIPGSVHRRADDLARRLGLSRSALYAAALRDFLTRHDAAGIASWVEDYNRHIESPEGQAWLAAGYQALASVEW